MPARINQSVETDLLEQYERWDPRSEGSKELLERLGVSRQTLYSVLARNGVSPKSQRGSTTAKTEDVNWEYVARMALLVLDEPCEHRDRLEDWALKIFARATMASPSGADMEPLAVAMGNLLDTTDPALTDESYLDTDSLVG
jgi:hypothetical protein